MAALPAFVDLQGFQWFLVGIFVAVLGILGADDDLPSGRG